MHENIMCLSSKTNVSTSRTSARAGGTVIQSKFLVGCYVFAVLAQLTSEKKKGSTNLPTNQRLDNSEQERGGKNGLHLFLLELLQCHKTFMMAGHACMYVCMGWLAVFTCSERLSGLKLKSQLDLVKSQKM